MINFPNCKINLGLNILRKRNDGYHDLETIFYPLPVKDALEIIKQPGQKEGQEDIQFTTTGITIEGSPQDNLCIKAYHLLKKEYEHLPPVRIHLHKNIPIGAGLGGGSSDGAFTLQLLNHQFHLGLSGDQLAAYTLQLGSDCPFFLHNRPCYASGRGEKLDDIALDLSQYAFLVVNPGIHINTGWAFSNIIPATPGTISLKEAIQEPIADWKYHLTNAFEKPVFDLYPEIKTIKDILYARGALYAAMSGSGSTVYGIFPYLAENLASLRSQLPYRSFLIRT